MPGKPAPVEVRFWSKVKKASGDACWEWQAQVTTYGYGAFDYRFASRAHRAAWLLSNGKIPKGLQVLHRCDNRRCVRPSHLFLGTQRDNVRDCSNKGRISRGAQRPQHKLTESQVLEIRRLKVMRGLGCRRMSRMFGVSTSTITSILNRKAWRHLV